MGKIAIPYMPRFPFVSDARRLTLVDGLEKIFETNILRVSPVNRQDDTVKRPWGSQRDTIHFHVLIKFLLNDHLLRSLDQTVD